MTGQADDAVEYWFYAKDTEAVGPITRDELVTLLAPGKLPPHTLVWREGFTAWQPASRVLDDPRSRVPTKWGRVTALAVLTLVAAGLCVSQLFLVDAVLDFGEADQASAIWAAMAAVAIIVGGITVAVLWQSAPTLASAISPIPGTARAAAVVLTTFVATFGVFGVAYIGQIDTLASVRTIYDDYTVAYDAKNSVLLIDGSIGPRFASTIQKAFDAHDVRRIVINSDGGLLEEAMAAAKIIEPHGVELVVRESCSSACIVIFAAGAKRYAHFEAWFGFHAAFPLVPSEAHQKAIAGRATDADEYIVARGAPRAIVDEANRIGAERMRITLAVDLLQQGFVNHVYDGDHVTLPLPAYMARWRAVEFALQEEYWHLAENLRAIRESAPNQVERHAGELDTSTGDAAMAAETAHKLIAVLRRDAVQAASDATVADYAQIYERAVATLVDKEDWESCAAFVDTPGWSYAVTSPTRFELANALGRMVKSAEDRDWKETKPAADAYELFTAAKAQTDLALMTEQDDDADRTACLRANKLAQTIAVGTRSVEAFRYADRFGLLSK